MNASSWDLDKFLAGLGPMQFMAPELLGLFINSIGKKLDNLEDALHDNDLSAISQVVHAIKGTAGQVQCLALAKMALDIEQSLAAGKAEQLNEYCQRLTEQASLDIKRIEAYLSSSKQA
ncbi:Hpt domain-containing protein [Arsukibacterium sp.]|uniref:Hpt domain-containing protein n=1 Tax=Arsukibacterium sp. TaxID=1977258 RepID=UPI002FDA5EA8